MGVGTAGGVLGAGAGVSEASGEGGALPGAKASSANQYSALGWKVKAAPPAGKASAVPLTVAGPCQPRFHAPSK